VFKGRPISLAFLTKIALNLAQKDILTHIIGATIPVFNSQKFNLKSLKHAKHLSSIIFYAIPYFNEVTLENSLFKALDKMLV
jgi:hypothetical protein